MKPCAACPAGQADKGRVRWHPSLRCVDTWMPPCLAHYPDANVRTNTACVHFTRLPFAAAPLCRTSMLALPPHRAVTSLPLSWHSPRCFYAMHGYKRRPPTASCPHQRRVRLR
jgi:hypothetical protein